MNRRGFFMVSTTDFRELADKYLDELIDRKEFSRGFTDLFYGIRRNGDPSAIDISYSIESVLTRAIVGLVSEEQLRSDLKEIFEEKPQGVAPVNEVRLYHAPPSAPSANCVEMVESPFRASFAISDTSRAAGFGSRVVAAL